LACCSADSSGCEPGRRQPEELSDPRWNYIVLGIAFVFEGSSLRIALRAKDLLVGEAADPRARNRIRELVGKDPSVERVGAVLTMQLGPEEVLLNVDVDSRDGLSDRELEQAISRVEEKLRAEMPEIRHSFIALKSLVPRHAP
jgi:divalent metal cation (Fe/Co/Zn/Cd) transporter